jgi:hypothetical protein
MALLNANNLGVYIQTGNLQTTPYLVGKSDPEASDNVAEAAQALADAGGNAASTTYKGFLVHGNGRILHEQTSGSGGLSGLINNQPAFVAVTTDASNPPVVTSGANLINNMDLAAAATSCSLETSLTIDEVVAKSGLCSAETYTLPGSVSWTITTDGLLEDVSSSSKAHANEIVRIAQKNQYVVVRFALDVTSKDFTATNAQQKNVSYFGQGLIESISVSGGFDEFTTYSATIRGYGKLYKYWNE